MAHKEWKQVTLRDICERIDYGYTARATQEIVGPKFLRITDIVPKIIDWQSVPFCKIDDADIARYEIKDGDIVIARTGATSGYAKHIRNHPKSVFASYLVRIRIKKHFSNRYVGLILESDQYKKFIKANISGSAQPQANAQILTSYTLLLPLLPTQHKIASILSAYDDLIENNTRRIAILEEMAQSLYQEWFVHFRYPGHEKNKMVESELGMIPEGWKVVRFRDVSKSINRGISPKYDETADSIVINQRCIRDGKLNLETARKHSTTTSATKIIELGDVLINSTGVGTLGRVTQIYQDLQNCTVDSHITIVRPEKDVEMDYFGYYSLNNQSHFAESGVGSTGQTELSRESIANTFFLLPPAKLQETFANTIHPTRKYIINLLNRNNNLRQTRDLLLPKLISGEIDVEALDIEIPDTIEPEERPNIPARACSAPINNATQLALSFM